MCRRGEEEECKCAGGGGGECECGGGGVEEVAVWRAMAIFAGASILFYRRDDESLSTLNRFLLPLAVAGLLYIFPHLRNYEHSNG